MDMKGGFAMLLSERTAIVTGGARGIGKGIALKYAEEGCDVVIADVLEEHGVKTAEEINRLGRRSLFIKCDVSASDQVQEMVSLTLKRFQKIDILVNNAGIGAAPKSFMEMPEEEWDRVLAVNLKGVFLCCRAVAPHMKEKGYGRIVNISSMSAVSPSAPLVHYSASKAGVLGLTKDISLELAPFNICVNAILPGLILTEIFDDVMPPGPERDRIFSHIAQTTIPVKRPGLPEDIAGVALFLASDLARYVTGDHIYAAGGVPLNYLPLSGGSRTPAHA